MTQASGARYKQLPRWRDATRLMLEVQEAVRRFPRYHKYTLGSELRRQWCELKEDGWLKGGMKRRQLAAVWHCNKIRVAARAADGYAGASCPDPGDNS